MLRLSKITLLYIICSSFATSEVQNFHILTPKQHSDMKLPISFVSESEVDDISLVENREAEIERKSLYNSLTFEFGLRYLTDIYLVANDKLSSFTISRQIEFYNESGFYPYIRVNLEDLYLSEKGSVVLRNSLESTYIQHSEQTPFYSNTMEFPYQNKYDVGSKIESIQLFFKTHLLYQMHFFSVGSYLGAGVNILNGEALYLRFVPNDINGSVRNNIGFFDNGEVALERGGVVALDRTSSVMAKYGVSMNFDFEPIHMGVGIDFGITNESNLYWIQRSYFLEFSYLF
jgi:hypothetical protein